MDLLADTYNYNHWIYSLCRPWLGKEVLEVGAGVGNLTQFLLWADRVVCVEPETVYAPRLQGMVDIHKNVHFYPVPLDEIPAGETDFSSVLCVNVLEHIEDDTDALRAMATRVRVGGHVVLYIPAVPWAFGELDAKLGHFRRYNKPRIRQLSEQCGLSIARLTYVNALGLFGWWWCGRIKREELIDPRKARFMDALAPYLAAAEGLIPPLLGQSLLAVLRKTGD